MTIDEAIKELSESAYTGSVTLGERHKQAEMLGIEALKLVNNLRFDGSPYYPKLLTGETEE